MYVYTPGHSRLIETGAYLPEERVTSREVFAQFDAPGRFGVGLDWLERTTGIKERRAAASHIKPSDMATYAAQEALKRAGLGAEQIDVVIYTGMARDHVEPATAHIVQHKLKAHNAIAFDVSNACLGFMSGVQLMDALIATGQARRGLVVTGEQGFRYALRACELLKRTHERAVFDDLAVGLTLGDAGAAVIMGPKLGPDSGFMGFMAQSQGQFHDLCVCDNGEHSALSTKMSAIAAETTKLVGPLYRELMQERLKWQPAELARYIPHQVGLRSVKKHAAVAQVSPDIVPITVDSLGNVISATIPVILHQLNRDRALLAGQKIYLSGTGSGICLTQAGLVWDAA